MKTKYLAYEQAIVDAGLELDNRWGFCQGYDYLFKMLNKQTGEIDMTKDRFTFVQKYGRVQLAPVPD